MFEAAGERGKEAGRRVMEADRETNQGCYFIIDLVRNCKGAGHIL